MDRLSSIAGRLISEHSLTTEEYAFLIENRTPEITNGCRKKLSGCGKEIYGNSVFIRGLIEISNICRNDCLYCGIRKSNAELRQVPASPEDILACADEGIRWASAPSCCRAGRIRTIPMSGCAGSSRRSNAAIRTAR